VHNGEKNEEPVEERMRFFLRALIMEGALVSETVPCSSRFESPCSCSIVSVRSSRVRLNLWFLWCVHVCARTHRTVMARRACEWVEDSPWKGVSIERESCACRCWSALRYNVCDKCTAAVGRETNETYFYRRETVRARYCDERRLKVRLDHCQIAIVSMTKGFQALQSLSRWSIVKFWKIKFS